MAPAKFANNGYVRIWQVLAIMGALASAVFAAQAYIHAGFERTMSKDVEHVRDVHCSDIRRVDENFARLQKTVDEIRCDVKQLLKAQWRDTK